MNTVVKQLCATFDLQPHPEGGYFKETYRSEGRIHTKCLDPIFQGNRNYATSIYFLLTSDSYSAFHKINQDETWHFYKGNTLKLHMISPKGEYSFVFIGALFHQGEIPQFTVPAHYYFAAEVLGDDAYSFLGCTVAPGFDFRDFHLPTQKELTSLFPQHKNIIEDFTRA